MNRGVIINFQSRLAEAGDVLEEANAREATRVEQAITDAEAMLAQLHRRHSELLIFIEDVRLEMERSINNLMVAWIARETAIAEESKAKLAELRETPAPKMIVNPEDQWQ